MAEAIKALLPAPTDRDQLVDVVAGYLGPVRLTFRRQKAKRGKFSHWYWQAKPAERMIEPN